MRAGYHTIIAKTFWPRMNANERKSQRQDGPLMNVNQRESESRSFTATSTQRERLIPNQVKTHRRRLFTIEVEALDRAAHVLTQGIPGIAFSEDALGETFGAEAAIRLLRDFKNDVVHKLSRFSRTTDRQTTF